MRTNYSNVVIELMILCLGLMWMVSSQATKRLLVIGMSRGLSKAEKIRVHKKMCQVLLNKNTLNIKKLLLFSDSSFLFFILILCFNQVLADLKSNSEIDFILKHSTFYLFTSPKDCGFCKNLEQKLKQSNQEQAIKIFYQDHEYQLPIQRLDPWTNSDKLPEYKKLGYLDKGIPQFSIYANDKVLGAASVNILASTMNKSDNLNLLPAEKEDTNVYLEKITPYFKKIQQALLETAKNNNDNHFDLTQDVLASLGVYPLEPLSNQLTTYQPITGINNVLIVGTAFTPLDNPLFNGMTIELIAKSIQDFMAVKPIVLYGTGKSSIRDTVQIIEPKDKKSDEGTIELIKYHFNNLSMLPLLEIFQLESHF